MDDLPVEDKLTRTMRAHKSPNRPLARLSEEQRREVLNQVLDRALNGERQADIAQSLGMHQTSLSYVLLHHVEDEWKSVQVARALTNLDRAEEELEGATDHETISRARERIRSAQWQLEKLHRRLFGQEEKTVNNGNIQINIGIVRE